MNRTPCIAALAFFAAACSVDSSGVDLLAPQEVEFRWDEAYNAVDDGISAVIPLDVLVYDTTSGAPLAGLGVTWSSSSVNFVSPHAVLSTLESCETCVWNPYRDELLELEPGGVRQQLDTITDDDGVARVYVVVDRVDQLDYDTTFATATVAVIVSDQTHLVDLVPR